MNQHARTLLFGALMFCTALLLSASCETVSGLGQDVAGFTDAVASGDAAGAAETFTGAAEKVADLPAAAKEMFEGDAETLALGASTVLNAGLLWFLNRKKKAAA